MTPLDVSPAPFLILGTGAILVLLAVLALVVWAVLRLTRKK